MVYLFIFDIIFVVYCFFADCFGALCVPCRSPSQSLAHDRNISPRSALAFEADYDSSGSYDAHDKS